MENSVTETFKEAKKTNPYYEEALNHQYAIQHVLNDGASITGRRFHGFDNIDDMIDYAKKYGFGAEIHEITCNIGDRWQKLFFDIDAAQELIESSGTKFSRLVELILSSIRTVFMKAGIYLDDITKTILCGNRPGKYSARIYFNLSVRAGHSKCIPEMVVDDFAKAIKDIGMEPLLTSIIDLSVYNRNHFMRMHTCSKMTKNGLTSPLVLMNSIADLDNINGTGVLIKNQNINKNTIITYIEKYPTIDCNNDYIKTKCCTADKKKTKNTFTKSDSNEVSALANEFVKRHPNYSIRTINGSLVNLHDDRTTSCLICKRKHDSENPLLIITNRSVYFKCRRAQKSIQIIKGERTKKTKFDIKNAVNVIVADKMQKNDEFKQVDNRTRLQYITGFYEAMRQKKRIAVKSDMGSGKSTELENYVKQLDSDRKERGLEPAVIVSVVHRISMRESMKDRYKRMGFALYNEIGGTIFLSRCGGRILIQVESLYRLDIDMPVDLLILDEYNAITQQFLSGLGDNAIRSREKWEYLCEKADSILMLDARLSPINVSAMEILSQNPVSIWVNETPEKTPMNVFVCDYETTWENKMIELILGGKRLDVVTMRGGDFCKRLKSTLEEKTKAKILILYGGCDNSEFTTDPNAKWVEFDVIIRSQTINAGVDFNVPHFHSVFVDIGSYGANSDDVLQSMRRSRNLLDASYYLLFKKCTRYDRPITEMAVIDSETMKINHNVRSDLKEFRGRTVDNGFKFRDVDDKLFRAFVHYIAYRNSKTNNIFNDIIFGLREMGANFEFITMKSKEDDFKSAERIRLSYEKIRSKNNKDIANARDIEDYEYANIGKYAKHTEADKAEMDKYMLRQTYRYYGEIDEEWVKKYRERDVIKLARNIYLRYVDTETILQMNREKIEKLHNDTDKLNIRLTGALRVALDEVKRIHSEFNKTEHLSMEFMKYINKQIEIKNPLFASKTEQMKKETRSIENINTIVLSSLGYEIVKKEKSGQTSKRIRIYNYEIIDTGVQYFTPLDSDISINKMPMLRYFIPH